MTMTPRQYVDLMKRGLPAAGKAGQLAYVAEVRERLEREERRLAMWAFMSSGKGDPPTPWTAFDIAWMDGELSMLEHELRNNFEKEVDEL